MFKNPSAVNCCGYFFVQWLLTDEKYELMALVLCCKDIDRQLQWEGKSKITEHTVLMLGTVQPATKREAV